MTADSAATRAEAEAILAAFRAAGVVPVEADILMPAGTLLDLYGEDIRARAYVTSDPILGEMMLRPDFTVPVVQAHMAGGAEPARYCYLGPVFRRQEHLGARAREYLQVGFEVFDRADPAGADAEVFALIARTLAPLDLRAATGDMGLLIAAVGGLSTTDRRKAALLRHIWRPRRFRALLDRFAGRSPVPPTRAALLGRLSVDDAPGLIAQAGPMIGLRGADEIAARAAALVEDAAAPPIAEGEAAALDELLRIEGRLSDAVAPLRAVAARLPSLAPAVDRLAARVQALADRGVDPGAVDFAASHGRTTLEYYDGFVFSFHGPGDMPPVASGGRYDALTAVLGQGRSIPAVGGVVRPALVAGLRGAGV